MLLLGLALFGWYTAPENLPRKTANLCQYFIMATDDIDADSQFTDKLQNVFYVRGASLELFSVIEGRKFQFDEDFTVANVRRFGDDFGWKRCQFPILNLSALMQFNRIAVVVFQDHLFDIEAPRLREMATDFARVGLAKGSDVIELIPDGLNTAEIILLTKDEDEITAQEFSFDALQKAVSQTVSSDKFALYYPQTPEKEEKKHKGTQNPINQHKMTAESARRHTEAERNAFKEKLLRGEL